MTFNDTKRKAMEFYHHRKAKETSPVPEFVASMGWFYNFKAPPMPSVVPSTLGRLRALMLMPLLCTRMNSGPSSRREGLEGTSLSRSSTG